MKTSSKQKEVYNQLSLTDIKEVSVAYFKSVSVHLLHWNSHTWSSSNVIVMLKPDVIISCRISAYLRTYGSLILNIKCGIQW